MNRRQFMAGAVGVAAVAVTSGSKVRILNGKTPAAVAAKTPSASSVVVFCTLYGGNDGLNTVVPIDDPAYIARRGNIAIAPQELLALGSGFGLNPSLIGMKRMWDANEVAIVRGVGYPDPSMSHFQSMDIWQSGSTKNDVASGWIGRWLDREKANPFRALSIGPNVIPAMVGERRKASALQDSTSSSSQLPSGDPAFLAVYRQLQRPLRGDPPLQAAVAHAGTNMLNVAKVASTALAQHTPPSYPSGVSAGDIGTQFGIVSQLIRAGIPTTAYSVTQGNYDTHAGEVSTQSANLRQLDTALTGFFGSLAGTPHATNTIVVIYTEFGRRLESNASGGADHGAANNVYVIGAPVHGGFYGEPPSLTALDPYGNLVHNVDFRSVFSTVLESAMGFESRPIFGANYPTLGFL
jgi:uncharacterized protein (DUF1501 family)